MLHVFTLKLTSLRVIKSALTTCMLAGYACYVSDLVFSYTNVYRYKTI